MGSIFKEDLIYLTSYMRNSAPYERFIETENGEKWVIKEYWHERRNGRIHEINLEKIHYLKSYYYADLEIFPLDSESGCVYKSTKALSSEIKFGIHEEEYASKFEKNVGLASKKERTILVKIKLTPIIPLSELSRRKKSGKIKRTKNFQIPGLKGLSDDISSLLNDETNADVILHWRTRKIYAHRNILCARSSFFSSLFLSGSAEYPGGKRSVLPKPNPDGKYKFTFGSEVTDSVLQDFLDYLYSSILKTSDFNELKDLLLAAFNFGVRDLTEKCLDGLILNINEETIEDICSLWEEYKYEKLKEQIIHYGSHHPEDVEKKPKVKECLDKIREDENKNSLGDMKKGSVAIEI